MSSTQRSARGLLAEDWDAEASAELLRPSIREVRIAAILTSETAIPAKDLLETGRTIRVKRYIKLASTACLACIGYPAIS